MFETRKFTVGKHKVMTYTAGAAEETLFILYGGLVHPLSI